MGWKGQFQGKQGYPNLEAVSDYNLWIWQRLFSYGSSPNDINIWDQLPRYESILGGTHDTNDFPFEINDEYFSQLYCLVDDPSLLQLLSTINNLNNALDCFLAPRQ